MRWSLALLPLVLASACAWPPGRPAAVESGAMPTHLHREAREQHLQRQWIGRSRQDLVQALGTPDRVMGVPGYRWPQAVILVYRGRDPVGGCIDAFVVQALETEPISNVFCR